MYYSGKETYNCKRFTSIIFFPVREIPLLIGKYLFLIGLGTFPVAKITFPTSLGIFPIGLGTFLTR